MSDLQSLTMGEKPGAVELAKDPPLRAKPRASVYEVTVGAPSGLTISWYAGVATPGLFSGTMGLSKYYASSVASG